MLSTTTEQSQSKPASWIDQALKGAINKLPTVNGQAIIAKVSSGVDEVKGAKDWIQTVIDQTCNQTAVAWTAPFQKKKCQYEARVEYVDEQLNNKKKSSDLKSIAISMDTLMGNTAAGQVIEVAAAKSVALDSMEYMMRNCAGQPQGFFMIPIAVVLVLFGFYLCLAKRLHRQRMDNSCRWCARHGSCHGHSPIESNGDVNNSESGNQSDLARGSPSNGQDFQARFTTDDDNNAMPNDEDASTDYGYHSSSEEEGYGDGYPDEPETPIVNARGSSSSPASAQRLRNLQSPSPRNINNIFSTPPTQPFSPVSSRVRGKRFRDVTLESPSRGNVSPSYGGGMEISSSTDDSTDNTTFRRSAAGPGTSTSPLQPIVSVASPLIASIRTQLSLTWSSPPALSLPSALSSPSTLSLPSALSSPSTLSSLSALSSPTVLSSPTALSSPVRRGKTPIPIRGFVRNTSVLGAACDRCNRIHTRRLDGTPEPIDCLTNAEQTRLWDQKVREDEEHLLQRSQRIAKARARRGQ